MQTQIFFTNISGVRIYARAYTRESARRIFSRSQSALAEKTVRIGLEAIKVFTGDVQSIGVDGYDTAVNTARTRADETRELRAMHRESYFNWALDPNEIKKDRITGRLMKLFAGDMQVADLPVEQINV